MKNRKLISISLLMLGFDLNNSLEAANCAGAPLPPDKNGAVFCQSHGYYDFLDGNEVWVPTHTTIQTDYTWICVNNKPVRVHTNIKILEFNAAGACPVEGEL